MATLSAHDDDPLYRQPHPLRELVQREPLPVVPYPSEARTAARIGAHEKRLAEARARFAAKEAAREARAKIQGLHRGIVVETDVRIPIQPS